MSSLPVADGALIETQIQTSRPLHFGLMRSNTKLSMTTHTHPFDAIFEPGNHFAFSKHKRIPVNALYQIAAIEREIIAYCHLIPSCCFASRADGL